MYNNPLITIPRLQYSWEEEEAYQMELGAEQDRKRRQAKARRSHFRSSPAGDQSIGGLGETGYRGAPPSIFANHGHGVALSNTYTACVYEEQSQG